MTESDSYRNFVQTIIDNVKKHGFPDKKVAFPIEALYESAEKKEINFNKVLETLDSIQIAHEKTPEKIIFYAKDRVKKAAPAPSPIPGMDPAMLENMDPSVLENMDPGMFGNMNLGEMMNAASSMMQNMSPEQLDSVKQMYENMSDDQRNALMEQIKKLGFLK